jgi:hypothetical protein
MKSKARPFSKTLLSILIIIVSAVIAIILHAALPAQVDESLLDGLLVKEYGFPLVAIAYFLVLFTHCTAVLILNRDKLISSFLKSKINFGLSFSLMYVTGMQEIVLGASPYTQWGASFVYYQLLMGIGDAIPAIILCILIGKIFFSRRKNDCITKEKQPVFTVLLFIVLTGTIRLIASYSGVIESDILDYSIPVAIWGYFLGFAFGVVYLLVESTTIHKAKTMLLGIGMNWMIFNSFIGLVRKDAMTDALLRSAIDVASIYIAIEMLKVIKKRRLEKT